MATDTNKGSSIEVFFLILMLFFPLALATPSVAQQITEAPPAPLDLKFSGVGGKVGALQITETSAFPVSPSNVNSFATPVAYYRGNIFVVSVEPPVGTSNGVNLRTVVRKGYEYNGEWIWETAVIDNATLDDVWHTEASIAVDKAGFVHVAYNMHHMPWQYAVSKKPGDILSFEFRGDPISLAEKEIVKLQNKTPFPSIGTAAIPGNQITYPAFFYDRSGELYITYRFATRPKRAFADRGYAFAISRYDVVNKQWSQLGAPVKVTLVDADLPAGLQEGEVKVFAYSENWLPQYLRIFFDRADRMHLSWSWREFYTDSPFLRPSYAYGTSQREGVYSANGTHYDLPVTAFESAFLITDSPNSELTSPLAYLTAHPNGTPYVVTLEKGKGSNSRFFDNQAKRWSDPDPMPDGAQLMEIDDTGQQWAFATGLKIFTRSGPSLAWQTVYEEKGITRFGYMKVLNLRLQNKFLIYSQSVDGNLAKIYQVRR